MDKNFLRYSKSFVDISSRESGNRRIDRLRLLDMICREIQDGYQINSIAIRRIMKELSDDGISISKCSVRNTACMIQRAYQWLVADEKGKEKLIGELSKEKEQKDYFRYLRFGIKCLEKDGIRTLEDIERLTPDPRVEQETTEFQTASEAEPEVAVEVEKPKFANISKKCGEEIIDPDYIRALSDMFNEVGEMLIKQNQQSRANYIALLDENEQMLGQIASLGAQNVNRGKKIVELSEKVANYENDIWELRKSHERLGEDLERVNQLLFETEQRLLDRDIEIGLLKSEIDRIQSLGDADMLINIASRIKAQLNSGDEERPGVAQRNFEGGSLNSVIVNRPLNNNGNHALPEWCECFNAPFNFLEGFTEAFQESRAKLKKAVARKLCVMSQEGPGASSLQISKLRSATSKSPEGAFSIHVGKFRVTMLHDGSKVDVFELTDRKDIYNN